MADPPKDPQKELERDLSELEERVDRLRASYEQYFMGYEKIEPGVQRKDVDRRFVMLRKTQIRNTAARYRFNVVTQKFNTYAMYWTRVCRQIEEGTFKRHIQKAARRFGGPGQKRDMDYSIDVELGDFDDFESDDLDAALAEANAHAESYTFEGSDTIPPGARTDPPGVPAPRSSTAFAMAGKRETIGSEPPDSESTPTPNAMRLNGPRPARQAALPAGAKQRVLLRRRGDDAPPSTRNLDANTNSNSNSNEDATRGRWPSSPDPPSSSIIRPAAVSGPQLPVDEGSRRDVARERTHHVHAAAPTATAAHRPPAIRHAGSPLSPSAASVGRMPVRPTLDTRQSPPTANPSAGQINTPASPMAPANARPPAPSGSRLPLPPPPKRPAPSGRLPIPPPSVPRIVPAAPSSGPPSARPDSEQPRPSRRPPPALPSKHSKKS